MSMQFQFEQPPEGDDSPSYVTKGGFYHVAIMEQDPEPKTSDGSQYLDGLGIKFQVAAGTHPDQFDKTYDCVFIKGNANQKDQGKFCNRKLMRLFLATGMMGEHVPGQQTTLDTSLMEGRQCVIELEEKPNSPTSKNPNGTHVEFKGAQVFHVDDPAVKDVPKHAELLSIIPKELRRDPSSFKKDDNQPPAAGTAAGQPSPNQPKPKLSVAQMIGAPGASAGSAAASVADVADV